MTATTIDNTIPLADCPGLVGLHPTPVETINVGDEVTIAGLGAHAVLTAVPDDILLARGTTFVATHPGTAMITVDGYPCVPRLKAAGQPDACALLNLQIT